jgi:hypothetical protein
MRTLVFSLALLASVSAVAQDRKLGALPFGPPGKVPRIPEAIRAELDLSYAGTDNPRQRLDL